MKQNELIKNEVVLYPGLDKDLNLKAIPLANTVITGATGAGKSILEMNIIKNLIEFYSHDSIEISIWDGKGVEYINWLPKKNGEVSTERWLPHIKHIAINSDWVSGEVNSVCDFMTREEFVRKISKEVEVKKECMKNMYNCISYKQFTEKYPGRNLILPHIVILDEFEASKDSDDSLIELLKVCENAGVFLIIANQSFRESHCRLLEHCKNILCLRCHKETSAYLLNSFIAAELPKNGYCYYLNKNTGDIALLKVPFMPETFLRKFVGSYSVRRQR